MAIKYWYVPEENDSQTQLKLIEKLRDFLSRHRTIVHRLTHLDTTKPLAHRGGNIVLKPNCFFCQGLRDQIKNAEMVISDIRKLPCGQTAYKSSKAVRRVHFFQLTKNHLAFMLDDFKVIFFNVIDTFIAREAGFTPSTVSTTITTPSPTTTSITPPSL